MTPSVKSRIQGKRLWALWLGITGFALLFTLFFAIQTWHDIQRQWERAAQHQAEISSEAWLRWVEAAGEPLRAMTALFEGSEQVSGEEFVTAVQKLEFNAERRLSLQIAYVRWSGNTPRVRYSNINDKSFSVGASLASKEPLLRAMDLALVSEHNQLSLPFFISAGQRAVALISPLQTSAAEKELLLLIINIGQLVKNFQTLHAEPGLNLRLFMQSSVFAEEEPVAVTEQSEALSDPVQTFSIKGSRAAANWFFFWDLLPSFRSGPEMARLWTVIGSGLVISIGGGFLALLLIREVLSGRRELERRLRAEQLIRDSQSRYKQIFTGVSVALLDQDYSPLLARLKSLRAKVGEGFEAYLDERPERVQELYSLITVNGVNDSALALYAAGSAEQLEAEFLKTFDENTWDAGRTLLVALWNRTPYFRVETTQHTLTEVEIAVIMTINLPATAEEARHVPLSVLDISESRKAQSERQRLENRLRHSQKMEAIGQLTSGVAHDFNNILAIVMGNLELLSLMLRGDPKLMERVEEAMKGAKRGAVLTKQLLGFSRKEAESARMTDVNASLRGMKGLIEKSLTARIEVELHTAEDLWPVKINVGDFEDAMINLALNARDAMPEGGRLVIETGNKVLDDDYPRLNTGSKAREFVMLSVSDSGTGMTEETREKLFEPFFTTKERGKGTGLGLSMVYGFVKRSGGHVKVYSEPGEGTNFRICLPRAREDVCEEKDLLNLDKEYPRGDETILVVDDEVGLVDIVSTHLKALGYRVHTANSAPEALALLENSDEIDLLLSDVIMPGGMNGYQLAVEAVKNRSSLKVLLTSGFTRKREGYLNGEDTFLAQIAGSLLNKPYSLLKLAISVRSALDNRG